jgi:serine/threonine protein kinase
MWACGIIMYMILERGRHPLYDNDDEESFLKKLKKPKWQFSERFSDLAKDLFLKLCNISPIERYTSE